MRNGDLESKATLDCSAGKWLNVDNLPESAEIIFLWSRQWLWVKLYWLLFAPRLSIICVGQVLPVPRAFNRRTWSMKGFPGKSVRTAPLPPRPGSWLCLSIRGLLTGLSLPFPVARITLGGSGGSWVCVSPLVRTRHRTRSQDNRKRASQRSRATSLKEKLDSQWRKDEFSEWLWATGACSWT